MWLPPAGKSARAVVLLTWTFLFVLLLQRDYLVERLDLRQSRVLERSQQEHFLGVYYREERIGFVKSKIEPVDDGEVLLDQQARLNLTVMERNYPVEMEVRARLSGELLLRDFHFSLTSPFYTMQAEGRVDGKRVEFTLTNGKQQIRDSILLADAPLFPLQQRGYLLHEGLREGDKRRLVYFDPFTLAASDVVVTYKGKEKKLVRSRIALLHHFEELFSGVRANFWLDDDGRVVLEESPAGFLFVREPEFYATSISRRGADILAGVAVPYQGDMSGLEKRQRISFRIDLPDTALFDLDGGRQRWHNGVLTLEQEKLPIDDGEPACVDMERELLPSPYIQSDHPEIRALAMAVTQGTHSALEKTRNLLRWVFTSIEKRPVIGIPDAVTTLRQKIGDCNEHAALFAALARALGLPARIASGVTWHQGAFAYHAWNEVCLGEQWVSLDTTTGQMPADLSHLRFVVGETKEQIRIGALLGVLRIMPYDESDDEASR